MGYHHYSVEKTTNTIKVPRCYACKKAHQWRFWVILFTVATLFTIVGMGLGIGYLHAGHEFETDTSAGFWAMVFCAYAILIYGVGCAVGYFLSGVLALTLGTRNGIKAEPMKAFSPNVLVVYTSWRYGQPLEILRLAPSVLFGLRLFLAMMLPPFPTFASQDSMDEPFNSQRQPEPYAGLKLCGHCGGKVFLPANGRCPLCSQINDVTGGGREKMNENGDVLTR